jgi:hypothetical protein
VENFRIETFRRTDEQQPPAATLVVDNGQTNRLQLAGLTGEQMQALLTASPAVSAEAFTEAPNDADSSTFTLQLSTNALISLPTGGFSALVINPAPGHPRL